MALNVSSHAISIRPPNNAKVGEQVTYTVDFSAYVENDEHQSVSVTLKGEVKDDGGGSGSSTTSKTVSWGGVALSTTVTVTATYTTAGVITIRGAIDVCGGTDTQEQKFNVLESSGSTATKMREQIRASLLSDLTASAQDIDKIMAGLRQPQGPALPIRDMKAGFPLPLSPGAGQDSTTGFGGDPGDDTTFFVGTWRGRFEMNSMPCKAEVVFQPGDAYSSLTESEDGVYSFWAVGTWKLVGKGNIQIQYKDWAPKIWNTTLIRIPTSENIRFNVINRNQVESSLCKWDRV